MSQVHLFLFANLVSLAIIIATSSVKGRMEYDKDGFCGVPCKDISMLPWNDASIIQQFSIRSLVATGSS